MDSMAHQYPAQFGLPLPTPGHGIVGSFAPPQRLDRADIGLAGKAGVDDALGLLDAVAETVLENRHEPALALLFERDDFVDLLERADERLLADHVFAGGERGLKHRVVHHRRRADVDDVEVIHRQQVVEICGAPFDVELVRKLGHALRIEVADREDLELVGVGGVALDDVRAADTAADDGNCLDVCHCSHAVPRSASICARIASSMAFKQRACGIAVSVRLSTSAISWGP